MTDGFVFEQTPLFQLNLMLWLVWSTSPTGIRPIFREKGFALQSIGFPIPTQPQIKVRANVATLVINSSANPDLLLRHDERNLLVPIECKLTSFGPDRKEAQQARVLLSASGSYIADLIGLPTSANWQAHLFYALEDDDHSRMINTLQELTSQLQASNIEVNASGSIGIAINREGVFLQCLPQNSDPIGVFHTDNHDGWLQVKEFTEYDYDPTPFYLIPFDASMNLGNSRELLIFQQKIRSALMSQIGSQLDESEFEITEDQIISDAIGTAWGFWDDRNARDGVMSVVRPYIREVLSALRKKGATVQYNQQRIRFINVTDDLAHKLRRFLSGRDFKEIDFSSQAAFGELSDEWQ